jgi:hypothetical protein
MVPRRLLLLFEIGGKYRGLKGDVLPHRTSFATPKITFSKPAPDFVRAEAAGCQMIGQHLRDNNMFSLYTVLGDVTLEWVTVHGIFVIL